MSFATGMYAETVYNATYCRMYLEIGLDVNETRRVEYKGKTHVHTRSSATKLHSEALCAPM